MDFQPLTDIWFLRTGIDDNNKILCKTQQDLFQTLTRDGNNQGKTTADSFQRADGLFMIRVDHSDVPYYALLQCDTVMYLNQETTAAFYVVGNIIAVEWRNPDCSFVRFKLDYFMTYQTFIDWDKTYAFIERQHVRNDWASEGGNPLFANMGPDEDFGVVPDTPIAYWNKGYECDKVIIISPYDENGEPDFTGKLTHGLYSSLHTKVMTPTEANDFFTKIAENKKTSINNIVGVYGLPSAFEGVITGRGTIPDTVEQLQTINSAVIGNANMPTLNNAKCMAAPFMMVKLVSSAGEVVNYNPQWFGNDVNNYELHITAAGAGGLFGGIAASFVNKNGAFNWRTYQDFTVRIPELPSCPHTLDGFADWQSINGLATVARAGSTIINGAAGVVRGATGAVTGATAAAASGGAGVGATMAVNGVVDTVGTAADMGATLASIGAQVRQERATGAILSGVSINSTLFDLGLSSFGQPGGWGFKVIYYTIQPYLLRSIDAFFDRFGYKQNRLRQINPEIRPYWTFTKTSECHVAATTGIPYIAELAINNMFNRGVTFWTRDKYTGGTKIGDFSHAKENKGIQGG